MGIKRFQWKYLSLVLLVGFILYGVASAVYIYRFRAMHIASVESYKNDILGIESQIAKLTKENKDLSNEIALLRTEILSFGEYATNRAAEKYVFQRSLDEISLNQISTKDLTQDDIFRILVTGHIYGSPTSRQTNPAKTLLNALPAINALSPDLFVSLGDTVFQPSEQTFTELRNNFFYEVDAPVLNAPGNHDFMAGRDLYDAYFGQSFSYFQQDRLMVIMLDTEVAHCHIVGKQKEMLEAAISQALSDESVQYIFVFMHRLLYLEPELSLQEYPNGFCDFGSNYAELREEIFLPAAAEKPVYLFAGDVGAFGGNFSPFYMQDGDSQLYTLAAGLGDSPLDVIIQIDIYKDELFFDLIPLGDKEFAPLEAYNMGYWSVPVDTE